MDLNDYSVRAELTAIRAELMSLVERIAILEMPMQQRLPHEMDFIATTQPLMADGVFEPNTPGSVSTILTIPNESSETIHFTPHSIGLEQKPYLFGRLLTIDGKKLEGVFSVDLLKGIGTENETTVNIIKSTTEKLNFSHPTKPTQRLHVEGDNIACEPGDVLMVSLESKQAFDAVSSKIVFEDLIFVEAQ